MFSVLFEVHPKSDQWDAYLGYAKMLRPELEQVEGFVDNIRYGFRECRLDDLPPQGSSRDLRTRHGCRKTQRHNSG
jgi:hypothetical protein